MFSPAAARSTLSRLRHGGGAPSPSTPTSSLSHRHLDPAGEPGPFPAPFSPAPPWSRRSPMAARTPPVLRNVDKSGADNSQPVFVSDFPQELRTIQAEGFHVPRTDYSGACGGMDQKTGLSWMLQGIYLFVWSHLSNQAPESCKVLTMPSQYCSLDNQGIDPKHGDSWAVCIVGWQEDMLDKDISLGKHCKSAGIVMCSRKSLALVYWPDIFSETVMAPVVSLSHSENLAGDDRPTPGLSRKQTSGWSGASVANHVNSMVATAVGDMELHQCVVIACRSSGELWRFDCSPAGVFRTRVGRELATGVTRGELNSTFFVSNSSCARSVIWLYSSGFLKEGWRQFLLLTATGLECWDVELSQGGQVSVAWSQDVLSGLSKYLAGQKQVWLLDLQVDARGERLKLLLASYSKDRLNSSSYMQYSLVSLSFQCTKAGEAISVMFPKNKTGEDSFLNFGGIQVILPKARIEEEEFLYSMRLRVGGKPEGSAMILAGDGTATLAYCNNTVTVRLYQFDLAWDAGKVLDASVIPSSDDGDDGSWVVLTEKAGIWAIPGKAVLLCGVEPPERSLSRRGSSNEGNAREERRRLEFGDRFMLRRVSSEAGVPGENRENTTVRARPLHDEEADALVNNLFQDFLASGQADNVLEKLQRAGAFEREGETNVFVRASRDLIDTLAKHWATEMVASAAVMAAISSQLVEKQRRHMQFLQFLSASKCHEELQQRQRSALHVVMEHGEKLTAMMRLRELHNASAQARLQSSPNSTSFRETEYSELGGALWDLVQVAGEKARRNNVILMDREKAEVFYSRVSELEGIFSCIHQHSDFVIGREQPLRVQIERTREIASACSDALRTAIRYRDVQQTWYPSPEGLTPWYCKPPVRSGLWKLATLILDLKEEAAVLEPSMVTMLISHLEELADILLETYAGAITAKVELEEEYRGLQMEYWNRRDTLLNALQQHANYVAQAAAQEVDDDADREQKRLTILKKLYIPLVSLARRHAGYQTLWDICTNLNDMECLRSLMRESMGLKEGRFSNFVFEQCYHNCQYARLLCLGEEFQEELAAFLQSHKDLLWLHELYMQRFTLASTTLHSLALSREAFPTLFHPMQRKSEGDMNSAGLKLAQRRRLLSLAKLSALAGGAIEAEERAVRIEADIGIVGVQEAASQMGAVEDGEMLSPRQLVEVCLKSESKDLVLRAFDIFALAGGIFRRSNRSLLESAWLRVADLDKWSKMRQASEREGWSDEQHLQALQSTALFHVAKRCYGNNAHCIGGTFHEVLPLLQEDAEDKEGFGSDVVAGSVEMVLMQHPDFPDAGQAMLTAIRMGKNMGIDLDEKEVNDSMIDD